MCGYRALRLCWNFAVFGIKSWVVVVSVGLVWVLNEI
jgi:hypothetical protein